MIENKPCKGQNKARGFEGCGKETRVQYRKFGLCSTCLFEWMTTTENGKIYYQKQFLPKVTKKVKSNWKQKKREFNVGDAMSLADTYFSRFIRLKYSTEGKCTCYTCGDIKDIKEVDNGHYLKREHKSTRYHKNNGRPQCKTCNGNTGHNGKQKEFRIHLVNEIGEEKVIEIEKLSRQTIKADYNFYKETADYYRNKLNELQKELKVKYW